MLTQHYVLLILLISLLSNLLTDANILFKQWLAEGYIVELNIRLCTMFVRPILHRPPIQYSLPHSVYSQTHSRASQNQYQLFCLCQHSTLVIMHSLSPCKPSLSSVRWIWTRQQKQVPPWLSRPTSPCSVCPAETSFLLLIHNQLVTHHSQIEFIHTY